MIVSFRNKRIENCYLLRMLWSKKPLRSKYSVFFKMLTSFCLFLTAIELLGKQIMPVSGKNIQKLACFVFLQKIHNWFTCCVVLSGGVCTIVKCVSLSIRIWQI